MLRSSVQCLLLAFGLALSALARAAEPVWQGSWIQGGLLRGQVPPGTAVWFKGEPLSLTENGAFVLGLDRDEPAEVEVQLRPPGSEAPQIYRYEVVPRSYKVQRIDGLPQDKVEPPPEVIERILREQALLNAAREQVSRETGFLQDFVWPSTGRISGVFGSQRILNGVPKRPHYGIDVAVPTGTPVRAPADGVITLAEPDLYFTGGTLLIDHGYGLSSILVHLSALQVRVGDRVRQGEVVGRSGMTGRATGPHLHWGLQWRASRLDPQLVVPPMPVKRAESR